MTGRSLRLSLEGIRKADAALIRYSLTQKHLAEEIGITRQPVSKFFRCLNTDRSIFVQICEKLHLDWEEVSVLRQSIGNEFTQDETEVLVQQIRDQVSIDINERCGTMRVLDMSQPIKLGDIFTEVNILEKITGSRWLKISDLQKGFDPDLDDFDRYGLGNISEERVPGLKIVNSYSKLVVLGKPGAGKTTFLKYLAVQCIQGSFQSRRVPIFITLKEFAETPNEPSLSLFIKNKFSSCGVTEEQTSHSLRRGRALILLDGLDEVREEDLQRTLKQIQIFSHNFALSEEFQLDQTSFFHERNKIEKKFKTFEISGHLTFLKGIKLGTYKTSIL